MASTGQQVARKLLVQISDGASPAVYSALCGITTRSFNLSANEVDTTIPDCANPEATPIKTGVPGILSRTFTGSGKFVASANTSAFMQHVIEGTAFGAKVIVPGIGTFTGDWFVSSFEFSGDAENTMEFNATFNPTGALTFEAEV